MGITFIPTCRFFFFSASDFWPAASLCSPSGPAGQVSSRADAEQLVFHYLIVPEVAQSDRKDCTIVSIVTVVSALAEASDFSVFCGTFQHDSRLRFLQTSTSFRF